MIMFYRGTIKGRNKKQHFRVEPERRGKPVILSLSSEFGLEHEQIVEYDDLFKKNHFNFADKYSIPIRDSTIQMILDESRAGPDVTGLLIYDPTFLRLFSEFIAIARTEKECHNMFYLFQEDYSSLRSYTERFEDCGGYRSENGLCGICHTFRMGDEEVVRDKKECKGVLLVPIPGISYAHLDTPWLLRTSVKPGMVQKCADYASLG